MLIFSLKETRKGLGQALFLTIVTYVCMLYYQRLLAFNFGP